MCGGNKGQSTQQTNQVQSYTPNPQAAGYITGALDRAGQTANLPFAVPQAPVAGFSGDQQGAFNAVRNAQGSAMPYLNQAASYFNQSAQPPDISQFFNPYASAVTSNLKDIFGQQQSQTTGQLTQAAGGVGADRIAVGQSELAKQQGLAAGQTLSGLYQPSLQAAQNEQNIKQSAGYGFGMLGPAAQNSQFQGANALLGTGGLQQQLSQAQMNSPYQLALAQAAFPYQQSQFLSGAVGALAPGLGGTTSGQGNSANTPAQPSIFSQILGGGMAGAGIIGQTGGFGNNGWLSNAFGSNPAYGGGNAFSGDVYGGSSTNPAPGMTAADYGPGFARGGRADPYALDLPRRSDGSYGFDDGGAVSDDLGIMEQFARTMHGGRDLAHRKFYNDTRAGLFNSETAPEHGSTYGGLGHGLDIRRRLQMYDAEAISRAVRGYDEGGVVDDQPIDISKHSIIPTGQTPAIRPNIPQLNLTPPAQSQGSGSSGPGIADIAKLAMMFVKRGGRINPYAEGGAVDLARGGTVGRKDFDGFSPYATGGAADDDVINPDEPYRLAGPEAMQAWRDSTPVDPMAFSGSDDTTPAPAARAVKQAGTRAPARVAEAAPANELNPYSGAPAAAPAAAPDDKNSFIKSPWAALTAAGLGIMGGTSPFAGVNIGQGGAQGLKTLEAQRTAAQKDTTIEQAAKRLEQEAKFHEDQYSRLTMGQKQAAEIADRPYTQMTAAQQEQADRAKRLDQRAEEHFNRPYNELTAQEKEQAKRLERDQTFKEMQPVKVGTDPIRGDIYARKDPATGEYIDIMTGKKVELPSAYQAPPKYEVPGSQSDADDPTLPPHARYTQGVTAPEGVNTEMLAQLPAQVANKIRAVDEGRVSLTSIPLRERGQFMNWLTTYDPGFDQSVWTLRNAQQRELSTNGNAGKMILAVNQLLPHLKTASDKAAALNNGDFKGINAIVNWAKDKTGSPLPGNFETVREVAAMDAARLLRGSGAMAEQDIEFWRNNLSTAGSPAQLQEKIKLLADDLMGARISSIEHSYRTNMRMQPPDFVSKEAKEALATIKERNGGKPGGTAAAAPADRSAAAKARYDQLVAGGMSKPDAYTKLHEEGF